MTIENSTMGKIPAINEVTGFDPAALARTIVNDDGTTSTYLDVKYRMLWFRLRFPNGKLDTEVLRATDQYAIVGCKVYADKSDPAEQFIAKSVAQRFASQEPFGSRFLELAETAAIGRALAAAGFGTQFCATDIPMEIADAPVESTGMPAAEDTMIVAPPVSQQKAPVSAVQQSTPPTAVSPSTPEKTAVRGSGTGMTVDEAKKVVVDFGRYKGSTLGQIAMINPTDLRWYIEHYNGPNKAVKAGADILVRAAQQIAG